MSDQNERVAASPAKELGLDSTVESALRWAREMLVGSETAGLDAQLLLGHVLGRSRAWLLAHGDEILDWRERAAFQDLVRRRARGEPVAYLRGTVSWGDLELAVAPGVLIPRPETEHLVEAALVMAAKRPTGRIADIGTGSGAIAIALARALPDARVVAVDVSEEALRVARANVERYGLGERITLCRGDLLDPVAVEPDLLVANLPYLSAERMASLPRDVRFEPSSALEGGPTGLTLYRRLLCSLAERGWCPDVVVEIDPEQKEGFAGLFRSVWPGARLHFLPDLAGRTRIVVCAPRERKPA